MYNSIWRTLKSIDWVYSCGRKSMCEPRQPNWGVTSLTDFQACHSTPDQPRSVRGQGEVINPNRRLYIYMCFLLCLCCVCVFIWFVWFLLCLCGVFLCCFVVVFFRFRWRCFIYKKERQRRQRRLPPNSVIEFFIHRVADSDDDYPTNSHIHKKYSQRDDYYTIIYKDIVVFHSKSNRRKRSSK